MEKLFIYIDRIYYVFSSFKAKAFLKFLKIFSIKRTHISLHNKLFVDKKISELNKNGYCVLDIENIFNSKKIEELYQNIEELKKNKSKIYKKQYLINFIGGDFLKGKKQKFDIRSRLYQLSINPTLLNIVEGYFKYYCHLADIQLAETRTLKNELKSKRIYSQRWHRDPSVNGVLKIFTYFSDVHETSGPFEYLQNTHSKFPEFDQKLIKSRRLFGGSFYPDQEKIDLFIKDHKNYKKSFIGKKGTIIIADTDGLHRGGYIQNGTRLMSTFVYYPSYDPIKTRFTLNRNLKSKLSGIQKDFF